jgi:segregation and condensation protein B
MKNLRRSSLLRILEEGFKYYPIVITIIILNACLRITENCSFPNLLLQPLSIIAYRQPVSKAEVESIRGDECGSLVNTLMERELITVKGRGETVGRPLLFGTAQILLESFGLENTTELPKLKEPSKLMGDNPAPVLFENDHATE